MFHYIILYFIYCRTFSTFINLKLSKALSKLKTCSACFFQLSILSEKRLLTFPCKKISMFLVCLILSNLLSFFFYYDFLGISCFNIVYSLWAYFSICTNFYSYLQQEFELIYVSLLSVFKANLIMA